MRDRYEPHTDYVPCELSSWDEMPSHWQIGRIKYMTEMNPSKSEVRHLKPDTSVTFLPMESIGDDGSLDVSKERPLHSVLNGYTYLAEGDVCVAKITPCFENGKGAIVSGMRNGIGFATTEVIPMRCNRDTDSQFLYYFLTCAPFNLDAEASMYGAGGQKRVADSFVANYSAAFPPEDEQKQIASFLDYETAKIDALIEKQQQLIALLGEKRQVVISHAVTKGLNPDAPMRDSGVEWLGEVPEHWTVCKCGFYLSVLSGFAFPSSGFSDNESDTRLLRGINVSVSCIRWDETVRWKRRAGDRLDEYEMAVGDLVIGMDRPIISEGIRVSKITEKDVPSLLLQRVASIKPGPNLNSDFLMQIMSSPMFAAHIEPETTGVSVPHISPSQIADFVIAMPPIEEQERIATVLAERLSKFDSLMSSCEDAMDLLQERRTALISAAVTGKIDVRGWKRPSAAPKKETEMEVA